MNPCPPPEQLDRLLADQLSPVDCAVLSTHIEHCLSCQKTLEQLTSDPVVVRAVPSREVPVDLAQNDTGTLALRLGMPASPRQGPAGSSAAAATIPTAAETCRSTIRPSAGTVGQTWFMGSLVSAGSCCRLRPGSNGND